jgi:hypothetical protein
MALNPVERRLARLCADWIAFRADSSKRLLVWQVPENAMRLVQCFFEAQKHDLEYSTGDLFIVLDSPFEHSIQYSKALKDALRGQYDASREEIEKEGLSTDWRFAASDAPDTATGVMEALCSFGSKYHETIKYLVCVLTPTSVVDDEFYVGWLMRALETNLPERLRLVIVDSTEHPRFSKLVEGNDSTVAMRAPAIDGLSTAQETFAQEAAVGPAAVFRNFLMDVMSLLEVGTADQVKAKATDAFNFARAQNWPDQEVVLRVLVAGALLKESRTAEAIGVYQAAREAAEQAVKAAHPAGQKLVLQTWFGEAGAHLAAGDPLAAAGCYDQAAIVAQQDANPILAIEAFRMGAFCHARGGGQEQAIQRCLCALELGERLKPEVRAMTSLPIAAVDLLRVVEPERIHLLEQSKGRLEQRLAAARRAAEGRAAEFERKPDPAGSGQIEMRLEQETALAQTKAERELDSAVAGATPSFRGYFAQARNLLGADWPLLSPIALPAAEEEATEVAAS